MQGHHTHHHDPHGDHDQKRAAHHAHTHADGHAHAPASYDRVFAIGVSLNLGYALCEAIAGVWFDSLALIADAGHNLSDVLGLLLAWGAVWLARRAPTARHSYGLGRSSILAALVNAVLLFVAVGVIAWEAVHRFMEPAATAAIPVIIVASIGIAINTFTAWLFMRGSKHDLNIRGAYLHMAADAAVSLGVVVAAIIMIFTGWAWLDPAISLVIAVLIAWSTFGLFRQSLRLSLDGVPEHVDAAAVLHHLQTQSGVSEVHDLHIWALSTEAVALTAHVVCPSGHPGDDWLRRIADELHEKFAIDHATIQVETSHNAHPTHTHGNRSTCGLGGVN